MRHSPVSNHALQAKVDAILAAGGEKAVIESMTGFQRKFCEEFVKDFDGGSAVIRAGSKTKTAINSKKIADQLLQHPSVRVYVRILSDKRTDKAVVDANYVLTKIVKTIEALEGSDGSGLKDHKTAAVILRAAELLGRHISFFVDRTEITGKDGGPIQHQETQDAANAFASSIARLASRRGEEGSTPKS